MKVLPAGYDVMLVKWTVLQFESPFSVAEQSKKVIIRYRDVFAVNDGERRRVADMYGQTGIDLSYTDQAFYAEEKVELTMTVKEARETSSKKESDKLVNHAIFIMMPFKARK